MGKVKLLLLKLIHLFAREVLESCNQHFRHQNDGQRFAKLQYVALRFSHINLAVKNELY